MLAGAVEEKRGILVAMMWIVLGGIKKIVLENSTL